MFRNDCVSWQSLAHRLPGTELEWQDEKVFRGEIDRVTFEGDAVTVHFRWMFVKQDKVWTSHPIISVIFNAKTPALKMGSECYKVGQMGVRTGFIHMTHKLDRSSITEPKTSPETETVSTEAIEA